MNLTPLKDILPDALKKIGINKKIDNYSVIINWKKIVGEKIANNSWPIKIDRDTLVLGVSNSVWSHHLLMLKAELIKNINDYLGGNHFKDIWFMAGGNKEDWKYEVKEENTNENEIRPLRLNLSEIAAAREIAEEIKDKKIRNKITYVIIKQMAMEKAKKAKGWNECANCGVLVPPEKKYCTICSLSGEKTSSIYYEKKYKSLGDKKIQEMLWEAPWLSYSELNKYIPCLPLEYDRAKKKLAYILVNQLFESDKYYNKNNNNKTCQPALTMLLSGIKPDKLTQSYVNKTISNIKENILKNAGR